MPISKPSVASLRTTFKRMGRAAVTRDPVYALARARALRDDPVTVLMYHTLGADDEDIDAWTVVRRGDFRRQIDFLRRHYDVVSLDDAVRGERGAGRRPQAVVTFDDGHATLHEHLLPIVEREALPVTVYVATGHIESGRPYWFDRAMNALQSREPLAIDLRDEGLGRWEVGHGRGADNWASIAGVMQALKAVDPQRREALSDRIAELARGAARPRFDALGPMRLAQLQDLAASRWVTLGAHSHCHNLLDQVPLAQASQSIVRSRELLQRWSGRAIEHFAYPNGNHDAALVGEVERLGFASAFTTRKGLWRRGGPRHAAPRVPVGRYDDLDKFKLELLGGLGRPAR